MTRILIAECKQEVSTFNPVPSHFSDFRVCRGPELITYHEGVGEEVGGALGVFRERTDVEVVPSFGTSSNTSGGVLAAKCFDQLRTELLGAVTDATREQSVDGVYFCLHGAMQAESDDDPEGALLDGVREIVGPDIPIVISLDLHGILTDRMLRQVNAVVIYHTYPHVDFVETGERAAKLLLKILDGEAKPIIARVKVPVLARGDEMITESGAISECIKVAQQIESNASGLAAGVMWGNPFTDVPELRTNAVVVTNGDRAAAIEQATDLANRFWKSHERMVVPLTSLEESIRLAADTTGGTVVLMDAADATSSGASGDSNAIVAEMMRQGYRGRTLSPVVDPPAVRDAFAAGVGATISTRLGGAMDPDRYTPIDVEAKVRSLSDGNFRSESFGWKWESGETAVLEADNYTFVVGTRPVSLFDRSWFYANGQDPRHFDAVVVKSPHCEPHMFADWCARLINVDAPGATSANVAALGHTKCARPIFPLDAIDSFTPEAEVFER